MAVHLQDSSPTFIFIQQNSTNILTVSNLYRTLTVEHHEWVENYIHES